MRKIFLLLGLVFSAYYSTNAQINGQTPTTALELCNTNVLNIPVVPAYWAGDFPLSCLASGGLNPMFYVFNVSIAGTLGFNITPNDSCSDYDFQLFNITGVNPNDVFTNAALSVSCNYSGLTACSAIGSITGCGPGGNGNVQDGLGTPINNFINATVGQTYLLMVSNFDENASGYEVGFTGTASIFDTTRPSFLSVAPVGCNTANIIRVQYADKFDCGTLDGNGSNYSIAPNPGNSIVPISAVGLNCSGGNPNQGDLVQITFNQFIPPGTYWLIAKQGNDGNSVNDFCDNQQLYTDSIQFFVSGGGIPSFDSARDVSCNQSRTFVILDKLISCATVALDGSDFTITGPQAVQVISAAPIGCVNGLTDRVRINFTTPPIGSSPFITTAGTYTVHVQTGSDGNTLRDSCGQQMVAGDSITFNAVASVVADFDGFMDYGCLDDSLILDNLTDGALTYVWNFGNGDTSILFEPLQIYPNQAIYTVQLIGNSATCADTISKNFDFTHYVNASFVSLDSFCAGTSVNVVPTGSTQIGVVYPGFNNTTNNNFPASYYWNFGNGTDILFSLPPNPPPIFGVFNAANTYAQGGIFTITLIITDTIGCKDTADKVVFIDSIPYHNFTILDSELCVGEPVYLYDTVANHAIGFDYTISDGYFVANTHNISHIFPDAGNYTITLESQYLICDSLVTTKNITVNDLPRVNLGSDTMICPGVTGPISLIDINNIGAQYIWSNGEKTNSIIVTQPGKYWLQVTDDAGCIGADTIDIKRDCYVSIPNAFTPDNDNTDDYFIPRELMSSGLTAFKMQIFNRWGELLFQTSSIDGRGWDGNWNGKPQPMGVYMYVIDATFRNSQKKKYNGTVTLIR